MNLVPVKKFMDTAGQEVAEYYKDLPKGTAKLRLNLMFEELHELAVAMGQDEHFHQLCKKVVVEKPVVMNNPNPVEILDAYCDLDYVISGSILTHGLQNVYNLAFTEVHENNMSKFCKSEEEAEATAQGYADTGIPCFIRQVGNYWVVKRTSDGKVLKPNSYKPVDLSKFVKND